MVFFIETQLRYAIKEYLAPNHLERNHQGVGNKLPKGPKTLSDHRESKGRPAANSDGNVVCHERLGGMLKYYSREAA